MRNWPRRPPSSGRRRAKAWQRCWRQPPPSSPIRGCATGSTRNGCTWTCNWDETVAGSNEVAGARAAVELAEQTGGGDTGEIEPLRQKVAANEKDHQARFDLAVALFGAGQREEAVDALLEIIRRDRQWNDEAARKQLLKFFDAIGPTDPLTVDSRRKLSSILFS